MKIKTECSFDAAHRLYGYEGKCSNLHGHRWVVEVEVDGPVDDLGIVFDFSKIKKIVDELDHVVILNKYDVELIFVLVNLKQKVIQLPFNPTAENLATYLHEKIFTIPEMDCSKVVVRVYESPKSYAEVD